MAHVVCIGLLSEKLYQLEAIRVCPEAGDAIPAMITMHRREGGKYIIKT
ncbi:MAG: hypothetical protein JSV44_12100 [Candidatus Zixiibacteriota bacterium]|nr:MAG: hypothetical protein JSV44_12100 [candidate division Zixibacteria bacterium]